MWAGRPHPMRDDVIAACTPAAPHVLHPKAVAKAVIHRVARLLAPPVHKPRTPMPHALIRRAQQIARRHAYLAPKIVAQAKIVVVCAGVGVGAGLGAGLANGDPLFAAPAIGDPTFLVASHNETTSQGDPAVPIPEPSSLVLLASGAAVLLVVTRRNRAVRVTS